MKRIGLWFVGFLACLVAFAQGCDGTRPPEATAASKAAEPLVIKTADRRTATASPVAVVSSRDDRGMPVFLWGTGHERAPALSTAGEAARFHLERYASSLGLDAAALSTVEPREVHDTGRGAIVVRMGQRLDGIEIYRSEVRLGLRRNFELVSLSGKLHPVGPASRSRQPFVIAPKTALAAALSITLTLDVDPSQLTVVGLADANDGRYQLATTRQAELLRPARVKKVYFPDGERLVGAFLVELYGRRAGDQRWQAWRYLVAADDGRTLERENLTRHDAFTYRVWADETGDKRPRDNPLEDTTPYPANPPTSGTWPAPVPSALITMEGFNHNSANLSDPWLPSGANRSSGNNADVFVAHGPTDGFVVGDLRAGPTSPGSFDYGYDFSLDAVANQTQELAGVVQAFYVANWMHDWFYDSGFDEAAGNAQRTNYGRGGEEGDPLIIETQDDLNDGQVDNSDMSTPSDGMSPLMHAYVWSGGDVFSLTVTPPGSTVDVTIAAFGPQSFDVTSTPVVVALAGTTTDACAAITSDVTAKVALVDRGNCSFKQKALNVQAAGAVAILIANNQADPLPAPLGDDPALTTTVTIPVFGLSQADGASLKASIESVATDGVLSRAKGLYREGTLDSTVVAHEWGHYIHMRLSDCASHQCGALSEGWGDFNALLMMLREGDDLDGTYAEAVYAAGTELGSPYTGLRRQPYSVDMTKDGLTFQHIADSATLPATSVNSMGASNSEVHNAGEVWATMLFEGYVALQKHAAAETPPATFEEIHRRMSDFVVAGLKLAPADATYTEARDAILAAAAARSPDDAATLAEAFARRGAGTCAVGPARDSDDFSGIIESFEVKPRVDIGELTLDDSVLSCNADGKLDAGEQGKLTLKVANGGPVVMNATTVNVATTVAGLSFPSGMSIAIPSIAPLSSVEVSIDVALDGSLVAMGILDVTVSAENGETCDGGTTETAYWRYNSFEHSQAAASDNVEASSSAWLTTGDGADAIWARQYDTAPNRVWRGIDYAAPSDTQLESPDLQVSATESLTIDFDHRYRFESSDYQGATQNWDGAVIELSGDGGTTWTDIATWADPGYGGIITDLSGNSLATRNAFVGQSPSWPAFDHVTLNLQNALAGQTLRIRFRIGTDEAAGEFGWALDNIAFGGIDNTPFTALVPEAPCATVQAPAPNKESGCSCTAGQSTSTDAFFLGACGIVAARLKRRRRWPIAPAA